MVSAQSPGCPPEGPCSVSALLPGFLLDPGGASGIRPLRGGGATVTVRLSPPQAKLWFGFLHLLLDIGIMIYHLSLLCSVSAPPVIVYLLPRVYPLMF